jgi:hypothetical protein
MRQYDSTARSYGSEERRVKSGQSNTAAQIRHADARIATDIRAKLLATMAA